MADIAVVHNLPLDYARPKIQQYQGGFVYSQVSTHQQQQLQALCQGSSQDSSQGKGATLFMGLHAAFSTLLARLSNETDIVIGSPVANREQAQVTDLIGFFVNTLVLRADLSGNPSFAQLIRASQQTLLAAYDHQQLPFEQIVESAKVQRSLSHSPLFQVMLVLQTDESASIDLPGLTLEPLEPFKPLGAKAQGISHFDLTLNVTATAQGLSLVWEYATSVFKADTIRQFAADFDRLLAGLLAEPESGVFSLNMVSELHQQQLRQWNDTEVTYSADACIQQLFEQQVLKQPDNIALVFNQEELSFDQLNRQANQLARYLIEQRGIKPDTLVGLCFKPSIEMVVAIWAILKAGGAYVPLDPQSPASRLRYMLEDADLQTVLTTSEIVAATSIEQQQALCLDSQSVQQGVAQQVSDNLTIAGLTPANLAYVIYTSGSTGKPKGVMVEHGGLVNLSEDLKRRYQLTRDDTLLLFAPITFDMSVEELFAALCAGSRLVIREAHWLDSVEHFYACCQQYGVTVLNLPTAFWQELAWHQGAFLAADVRHISVGGDKINELAVQDWYQKPGKLPPLLNAYGPTECTVNASFAAIKPASSSIGRALSNTQLYVLNPQQALCPVGVAGELCVGGVSLARGYLNRDDLTAKKFIDHPFAEGQRLYKTGDLVRWMANGEIECLGRVDYQIKIRGFRIELGEIEAVIGDFAGVKESLVVLTSDEQLVAYVVTNDQHLEQPLQPLQPLQQQLADHLPAYMVPTAWVLLDQLPLTANGKVDRKALPMPEVVAKDKVIIEPVTDTERQLLQLWQQVLSLETISMDDNFFALGGHSLLAMRLVTRINKTFAIDFPLRDIFSEPVLSNQAAAMGQYSKVVPQLNLTAVKRTPKMALSFAQQRLWLLSQIDGSSSHYNMPTALKLEGALNLSALNQAFNSIIARHEVLRTCIAVADDGQPYQRIIDSASLSLGCIEAQQPLQHYLRLQAVTEFDLSADLMIRAQLLKQHSNSNNNSHILLVTTHHIAFDGWSSQILIDELCALYRAYAQGQANPLPALSIQYADYAHWQRQWLQGEVLEKQLDYWQQRLADLPQVHSVPLDFLRPQQQSFNGASYVSDISAELSAQLQDFCQQQGATLFMGLHGVFSTLLARLSNEHDIVLGTPVANREQDEVADLIGFFVNTLVLRADLSEQPDFVTLLAQSKQNLLDAYKHQQVPFEQVVETLQPERSLSHSPLFQLMLVLQNNESGTLELPGLRLSGVEQESVVAKYDITLFISENDNGLCLGWQYNRDLFSQATIAAFAGHFEQLLTGMLNQPTVNVLSVPMLTNDDRQLMAQWNDTAVDFDQNQLIQHGFESQVLAQPQAIALMFAGESLSYEQLNRRANQLARYLMDDCAVTPDSLVGICLERSIDMVVAILAVLKAGGAYVPLDPNYPKPRLDYLLADSGVTTVLSHECWPNVSQLADDNIVVEGLTSRHLAYVIYTSGSTGLPKGVMVEHQALVNRINWMQRQYGCDSSDNILQKTPFSFDVSVWEFIWPLSAGATLVLAKPGGHQQPDYLTELIQQAGISKLHFVPSMLSSMLSLGDLSGCDSLRQVFSSGEALAVNQVEQFNQQCPQAVLHNLYGPTEAAIDVSFWDCSEVSENVPIGRPIDNIQLQVLDRYGALVPVGVPGELHIAGVGLARGYLNQPELTAERFIDIAGQRWYKTGDLVRRTGGLVDGELVYMGRLDHQVKIRGFRIELGEIEAVLLSLANVSEAAVIADNDRLIAYVVSTDPTIVNQLTQQLPEHMVPTAVVELAQLPVTANGKLDRKALPSVDMAQLQSVYIAPSTATELLLAQVWQQVLGLEKIGVQDSFFALGGHSLLVMQVIAGLQQASVNVSARLMFSHHQLSALAAAIDADAQDMLFAAPANLIPADCSKITPAMLPLVSLSESALQNISVQVDGGDSNIQDIYPLGQLQQGMLFHHISDADNDPYLMSSLFRVSDKAALTAFLQGLQFVIDRHDVLRTSIFWQGLAEPVQVVLRQALLNVQWTEKETTLSHQPSAAMDLSQGPCIRLTIAQTAENGVDSDTHFILIELHHIIADHVTLEIIQQEISLFHQGLAASLAAAVPYRNFIAHTQHQATLHDAKSFFTERLADVDSLSAPYDLLDIQNNPLVEVQQPISDALALSLRQLSQLSQQGGFTAASYFHAAWAIVVGACCGRDDVVFGTVLSGRLQGTQGAAQMPGVFINTLPLRVKLADVKVSELVEQVQQSLYDLLPYEQVSLAEAQRCSGLAPDVPLFTAMINYRHSAPVEQPADVSIATFISGQERSNYPFSLLVDDFADGFAITIQACQSVSAQRIADYVIRVLEQLCSEQQLNQIRVVGAAERQQLLCHQTQNLNQNVTLTQLFEQQVARAPDSTALLFDGQKLSYDQLNSSANRLASYLVNQRDVSANTHANAHTNALVGICLERSFDTVIAVLAVLKAGGAYVPLDPDYPAARLNHILSDAQLTTVLTHTDVLDDVLNDVLDDVLKKVPLDKSQVVCIDSVDLTNCDDHNPTLAQADDLAYVIYTSGSTGLPKGVKVSHHNVVRLLTSSQPHFGFDHNDVWTLFHSFAFDFSVWELWGALAYGGSLVVVPYWLSRSAEDFYALVAEQQVTVLNQTPSAFTSFIGQDEIAAEALALRYVIFGSEALNLASLRPWFNRHGDQQPQLINMYGITETTVHVTYRPITIDAIEQAKGASLIGKPLADLSVLVLDQAQRLSPTNVSGEMYVGGAGLSQGYLNQPALTASRFVTLAEFGGQTFYRTGDNARFVSNKALDDGELEYLGRIDQQVKIRGFRIELGEIQHALMAIDGVQDAFVTTAGEGQALRIVAYVVSESMDDIALLREALAQQLPAYMIPAALVVLASLPLTTNGKVDVKQLPQADVSQAQQQYQPPTTLIQRQLCQIWQQVLDIEQVGISDNYFAIGGDSILSIRIVSQARQQQLALSIEQLFAAQTIEKLAQLVEGSDHSDNLEVAEFSLLETEEKQLLADLIDSKKISDAYPLSYTQQGMVFHHLLHQEQGIYHDLFCTQIHESWSYRAFTAALTQLVTDNELLRSVVFNQGPRLLHTIYQQIELPLQVHDWRHLPEHQRQAKLVQFKVEDVVTEFKADRPLWYITIHQLCDEIGDNRFHFSLSFHHALLDGWSVATLQSALLSSYLEALENKPCVSQTSPLPYRYFIGQELQALQADEVENYWSAVLTDCQLPWWTGQPQSSSLLHTARHCQLQTTVAQSNQLMQLAKQLQVHEKSLFLTLHLQLLNALNGSSGSKDIATSVVFNGRPDGIGSEDTLGLFLNTLPFNPAKANGDISWTELIQQVDGQLLELSAYRKYPLAKIQHNLDLDFSGALFNYVNFHIYDKLDGVVAVDNSETFEQTNYLYALTCAKNQSADGVGHILSLKLDDQLFSAQNADFIEGYFARLIDTLCQQFDQPVSALKLLGEAELSQLQTWNQTDRAFADDDCVTARFEAQVAAQPQATALMFEGESLSYQQLNRRANQLAHYLVTEYEVKPDVLVGICLARSINMVVAILAVLKAGAAYVPLDPSYPQARIDHMVADSGMSTVLSQQTLATIMSNALELPSDNVVVAGLTSRHLAYVIYTSGSTGLPKGVMVEHQALVNRISWMQREYGCDSSDRILQKTPFSFDVSVWEFIWPLSAGATLVLAKPGGHQQPDYLTSLIQQAGISKLHFVPSMLSSMLSVGDLAACDSLRQVFSSGEALAVSQVQQFNQQCPQAQLHNLYGPTEAAIDVSFWPCADVSTVQSVPIGQPIDNIQCQVLDSDQTLVPIGAPGELHIGGVGLARGYLNQPDLTAERFITINGQRWYKSGDLVRWADGHLIYMGRLDHQVKIRGFRIELGEIEAALLNLPQVSEALVIAVPNRSGDLQLVAYVVGKEADLRTSLAQSLPDHMVPSALIFLDAIPVTSNGKADRKALPAVDFSEQQQSYVAPSNAIEQQLAELWHSVLALDQIGINDNFFAIGGHSLTVIQLLININRHFSGQSVMDISLKQFFAAPTIAQLSVVISNHQMIDELQFDLNDAPGANEMEIKL